MVSFITRTFPRRSSFSSKLINCPITVSYTNAERTCLSSAFLCRQEKKEHLPSTKHLPRVVIHRIFPLVKNILVRYHCQYISYPTNLSGAKLSTYLDTCYVRFPTPNFNAP